MDHEEVLNNFVAITSTTPEVARPYLELTDHNLEQAVNLFFANDGAPLPSNNPPTVPQTTRPSRSTGYQDDDGVVHLDSDDDDAAFMGGGAGHQQGGAATFEDDAAMARRLQEEMYGGSSAQQEEVRAPIARTTETLVGPDFGGPDDMHEAIFRQVQQQQSRARSNGRPGIFNQREVPSSIWHDGEGSSVPRQESLSRATGGASDSSARSNMLAQMFRPPYEIITRLPWELARDEGREKEKWLLVDVQNPAVFDCQVLNRDIWKDPSIVETVKENFIFLQFNKNDAQGAQYVQYYFPNHQNDDFYPHIAIVDPRTGEQLKVWSGAPVIKAPELLMQLHEFLDRYSLDTNVRNPVAKRKADVAPESRVDAMTEEEQLEWAMRNSLAEQPSSSKLEDPDDLTRSIGDIEQASAMDNMTNEDDESSAVPSAFASIPSDRPHTEPAADPATTTRIQFRHSGGRVIRRFALSDPVQRLYEWLKASPIEGKKDVDFELVSLGKNLMEVRDSTVQDAGLKNGTVMIEFLEDE